MRSVALSPQAREAALEAMSSTELDVLVVDTRETAPHRGDIDAGDLARHRRQQAAIADAARPAATRTAVEGIGLPAFEQHDLSVVGEARGRSSG